MPGAPRAMKPLRVALRALLFLLLVAAALAAWELFTWPNIGDLASHVPRTTAFIERYRAERRRAGQDDHVAWTPVPYERISPHLKRAVLVAEDIDFFSHHGFEVREMKNAMQEAWEEKEFPRGASTLTQQLAKNLFLSPSRNPLRKLKEAILTRQLEDRLGKRRILELYLDVMELGPGIYGAEAAARHYFGKPAAEINEREAAELAASLPRPSTWHPGAGSRSYQRYVMVILGRMDRAAWLWKVI